MRNYLRIITISLTIIVGCILITLFLTNSSLASTDGTATSSTKNVSDVTENRGNVTKKQDASVANISLATLSVATDRIKYVEGQSIRIFGTVYDEKGEPVRLPITVKVRDIWLNGTQHEPGKTMYSAILIPNQNGTYSTIIDKGLPFGSTGKYSILSIIISKSATAYSITSIAAITEFSVQYIFMTTAFKVLYIGGGIGFGGIIIIVILGMFSIRSSKRTANNLGIRDNSMPSIYEMFQFIFITILAFTPIAAFALTDVELFPNSPVGIIIDPSENATMQKDEWKINIGGNSSDRYSSGIQVPVAIFIFGIAGGYMRYLFSQAEKLPEIRKKLGKKIKTEDLLGNPIEVFYGVLQDVAFLFLSPLLAIAVWLVLFQGGTTSVLTLTAVSFVTGLVTKEVGKTLVAFAKRMLQIIDVTPSKNETTNKNGISESETMNGGEQGESQPTTGGGEQGESQPTTGGGEQGESQPTTGGGEQGEPTHTTKPGRKERKV